MRIALALAAFLAFAPNAIAAKSGDKQFTYNVELRERYQVDDNMSGSKTLAPNNGNNVEQRLKLTGNYKLSEKFAVTATLLNNFNWGSSDLYVYGTDGKPGAYSNGDGNGIHNGATNNNLLNVQEAYGSWMVSDDLVVRFGRGGLTMADGSVISQNDYEPFPYSFDGILANYEFGIGRISAWIVKFASYSGGAAANAKALVLAQGGTNTTQLSDNGSSDPEADAYGIAFDLKKMPEWLKVGNIHLIHNSKATTPGAISLQGMAADPRARMGQDNIRYGIALGGEASRFDYKADFAATTGKYKCAGSLTTGCDGDGPIVGLDNNGMMYQAEVGFNYEELMKSRVYVKYHSDSGDKDTAANATKIGTYDAYYYDQYDGSGNMEVVGWGNLTFINAGFSLKPTDQMTINFGYFNFMKTEKTGQMNPGRYGNMVAFTSPNSSNLGQEFDLSAEQKYDGGFAILSRVGYFIPGSAITNGLVDNNLGTTTLGDSYFQFMLQGKMVF
jgi:hypothetical protein